jgi:hypothetical protein
MRINTQHRMRLTDTLISINAGNRQRSTVEHRRVTSAASVAANLEEQTS